MSASDIAAEISFLSIVSFMVIIFLGMVDDIKLRGRVRKALIWKLKGSPMTSTLSNSMLDDLYELRYASDRDSYRRSASRILLKHKEVVAPEPKTALGHFAGWSRRVGAIVGGAGAVAALVIGDILAWQNLHWIEGVGITTGAVGIAAGTIWYIADEYDTRH